MRRIDLALALAPEWDDRGALPRADQAFAMRAHAGEGVDAALPRLIPVVASDEIDADVADGASSAMSFGPLFFLRAGRVIAIATPVPMGSRGWWDVGRRIAFGFGK